MPEGLVLVETSAGTIRGQGVDGVVSFKGVPYAAPPVGERRWRAPEPVTRWDGVRDAVEFASDCVQAPGDWEDIRTTPSEDCLYVNVWSPDRHDGADPLPVLVWIHGGGYVGGGTSVPVYDGAAFARRGLVVVSVNYRLGRIGFFAHPALVEADEGPVGNYGLLDQLAALRWVQANVVAFGGDPARVTIMGESAGGDSVIHLVTSPSGAGLFHQAVVLSGGGRRRLLARRMTDERLLQPAAPTVDRAFALRHGIRGSGRDALERLRELDARVLVGSDNLARLAKRRLLGAPLAGVPVIDDVTVVGEPQDHFLAGDARPVPVLIGSTAVDVPCHLPPSRLRPLSWFGADEDAARAAYDVPDRRLLPPKVLVRLLLSIGADLTMHEPARFVAETTVTAGKPAFVYRFTYTAESTRPESLAQTHAGEVPFLFDTIDARYGDAVTPGDRAIATTFNRYVANFAISGDPNGPGLTHWPEVVPGDPDLMHFALDGPVVEPDPRPGVALVARARAAHASRTSGDR